MNRSMAYITVFAGLVCGATDLAAEESEGNVLRLQQLVYSRQQAQDNGERFAKMLEKQPTAAGAQQTGEQEDTGASLNGTSQPIRQEGEESRR